ncbi:MAG: carotenoid oxygenase [Actinobacteria bacterium]|nr:carotenoid oxygenase [Actinomycetota bacterium]
MQRRLRLPAHRSNGVTVGVPTSAISAPHQDLDLEVVAGAWPEGVRGDVVFSAPQVATDLPFALFGFGVMCRLSLRPGQHGAAADRFAWRASVIDSPSQRLHAAAASTFRPGPTGYMSSFGFPNATNTAPLPWDGRLFATWDVGRPVELDPTDLTFLGDVGSQRSWGDATLPGNNVLPFYFSTAHPVIDPERQCLWTVKQSFNLDGSTQLHVVHWDGLGTEVSVWPITNGVLFGSSHTVSQTRDYLVLADSGNFKADPGEMAGGPRTVTIDDDAAVYLVRKDALLESPVGTPHEGAVFRVAPTTGHYYACWDDADGVRVLFEHMDRMDLGLKLEPGDLDALGRPVDPGLIGFYNTAMAPSTVSEVLYDPVTGQQKVEAHHRDEWSWNLELSAMDWSLESLENPVLHHIAYQGYRPGTVSRRALDLYGDRIGPLPGEDTPGSLVSFQRGSLDVHSRWEYPDVNDHITSPAFAPDLEQARGGQHGWVVLPVLSDEGFRVELFDAGEVGRGPVAVLASPGRECVPVLLHSAWMRDDDTPVDCERLRFGDDIPDGALDALTPELAGIVNDVVADLDAAAVARHA